MLRRVVSLLLLAELMTVAAEGVPWCGWREAEAEALPDAPSTGGAERDPLRDALKSYEELTRLLITLTTGTLVLAPTVLGAVKRSRAARRWALRLAVWLLLASLAAGILCLSALAGAQRDGHYDISAGSIKYTGILQWCAFGAGLLMFCVFALANLGCRGGATGAESSGGIRRRYRCVLGQMRSVRPARGF